MTRLLNPCIEEVCWEDVRKEVAELNCILAKLIDQVEPDAKLKLFRVYYPFGAYIFYQNQVYFPLNLQKLVSMGNHHLPSKITHQLNYASMPLAVLMNKKIEVFTEHGGQVTPLNLINSGELLGLGEFFEAGGNTASYPWQMTAGGRSIFFLPQIADEQSHRKLKTIYQVKHPAPKKLAAHWHVFREITRSINIKCDWHCELLFISEIFIKKIQRHPNYLALKYYLMKMLWKQTQVWRNRSYMEVNWQTLLATMGLEDCKKMHIYMPVIRRILEIGNGVALGFRPAVDETVLPLKKLQMIYLNDYGLKEYIPVMMQPHYSMLPLSLRQPVYFSLLFPNPFYYKTKTRNKQSTLNELKEVIYLNEVVSHWLLKHNFFGFSQLNQLHYKYFHSDADILHNIRSTAEILQFDNKLAKHVDLYANRKFPERSPFLRGSILILKK